MTCFLFFFLKNKRKEQKTKVEVNDVNSCNNVKGSIIKFLTEKKHLVSNRPSRFLSFSIYNTKYYICAI